MGAEKNSKTSILTRKDNLVIAHCNVTFALLFHCIYVTHLIININEAKSVNLKEKQKWYYFFNTGRFFTNHRQPKRVYLMTHYFLLNLAI